jgi:Fic family protein
MLIQYSSERAGTLVQQQGGDSGFKAFIPSALPPAPPLEISATLGQLVERASVSIGRLDGLSRGFDLYQLLYMYVRKEAVLSSEIEGTQSTLVELLEFESADAPGTPVDDVVEVSRYVRALHHAVRRMTDGFPLSLRLLRETHEVLMASGRGSGQAPGEFRRTQNWIGGTRPGTALFVPPPPHELLRVLGEMETFIAEGDESPIIKAGLTHAQFETIHPFLDGNGRIGRMLITMMLCDGGVLSQPILYLSLYFRRHRTAYYDALQRVRTHGDWEGWMRFYLEGIEWTSRQAIRTTLDLLELFSTDRGIVKSAARGATLLRVYDVLQQQVIVSIRRVARELDISVPTATSALTRLQEMGIARETTGRKYGRLFAYDKQLAILDRME